MTDYQERVANEKKELDDKLERLTVFMCSDRCEALPPDERVRMRRQRNAMLEYSKILGERITAFPADGK